MTTLTGLTIKARELRAGDQILKAGTTSHASKNLVVIWASSNNPLSPTVCVYGTSTYQPDEHVLFRALAANLPVIVARVTS